MRSFDDLINDIGAMHASDKAPTYEKAKAEFTLKCVNNIIESIDDLNNSIKQNSISNEKNFQQNLLVNHSIGYSHSNRFNCYCRALHITVNCSETFLRYLHK